MVRFSLVAEAELFIEELAEDEMLFFTNDIPF